MSGSDVTPVYIYSEEKSAAIYKNGVRSVEITLQRADMMQCFERLSHIKPSNGVTLF
jgi:2-keto-3-deoxy-6-phosphogluconate aldolase